MAGIALVIAVEAAAFHQPAKGALDHPAPGQQHKTFGLLAALDDLQAQPPLMAPDFPGLRNEAFEFPGITAVGDMWLLADLSGGGSITGTFTLDVSSLNLGGLIASFDNSSGILSIAPEPSRALLLMLGLCGALMRRRRMGFQPQTSWDGKKALSRGSTEGDSPSIRSATEGGSPSRSRFGEFRNRCRGASPL